MNKKDIVFKNAKPRNKDYKVSDEKGLYLLVTQKGAKYWKFKYRFGNKEKKLSIGVYPEVTLKEARNKRDDARILLRDGIDPSAVKSAQKAAGKVAASTSFEVVGREWFNKCIKGKSDSHVDRTWRILEKDLFPYIGTNDIGDLDETIMLDVLKKIEARGVLNTLTKAIQAASQIFRYAIATRRAKNNPIVELRGAFKTPESGHFAAITEPERLGNLMLAIEGYTGTATGKSALQLSPHVFVRPVELRSMKWDEIKWKQEQWEIPGEKMKLKRDHIVPLTTQAIEILKQQQLVTGNFKYVFPNQRGASRPLSENAVRTALRTLGYSNDDHTPHGFRATARTIMDEVLGFRVDIIEHQLAHIVKDANGRAYNRTKFLSQRKVMMQKWSNYLDALRRAASGIDVDFTEFMPPTEQTIYENFTVIRSDQLRNNRRA